MAEITGKTARLLNRLQHFYNPDDLEKSFLKIYDVFGKNLEQCERDLFEVLRSHHVQTADNVGSKGYIAPDAEKGDLDKLFSLYLESLGGTSQLVSMNPLFTTKSFDAEKLLNTLKSDDSIITGLKRFIIYDEDSDPVKNFQIDNVSVRTEEINSAFVFSLITGESSFTEYLRNQLNEKTLIELYKYEGDGVVTRVLAELLTEEFNTKILKDPFLFKNNFSFFSQFSLDINAQLLRNSLNKEFLKSFHKKNFQEFPERYNSNITNLQIIIDTLNQAEAPEVPALNQVQRFNRMLIDHAAQFQLTGGRGWGFQRRQIPAVKEVREIIKERLNALLQSNLPETEDVFGLISASLVNHSDLKKLYSHDRLHYRRILLEAIFPYEIQQVNRVYQERLTALIKVLRKGASTRDGIRDIVAANFGLIGDTPDVIRLKELIQIQEFDPVETCYYNGNISIQQQFSILNDNKDPVVPKIKVTMLESRIKSVQNLRFRDVNTGKNFVIPVTMKAGDSFVIENETIFFNGLLSSKKLSGPVLSLPSLVEAKWDIDAEILSNTDRKNFGNLGRFDTIKFGNGIFIDQNEPVIHVEILTAKLTYGAFSIKIPWHIEGVTDKFAENTDHPRHKILDLVQKVKAAGVRVQVSYFQNFSETHDLTDQLFFGLSGSLFNERHELEDSLKLESRLGMSEKHDMDDRLRLSGVFNYTTFESGNTFA